MKTRTFVIIGNLSLLVVLIVGMITIWMVASESSRKSRENNGYLRYVACVVDVRNEIKAVSLPDGASEKCWKIAENEVGVKLKRYSKEEFGL